MENVCKMVPSLRGAKVVQEWVGLRPYREPVRLELNHHKVQPTTALLHHIAALPSNHCRLSTCDIQHVCHAAVMLFSLLLPYRLQLGFCRECRIFKPDLAHGYHDLNHLHFAAPSVCFATAYTS